MLSATYLDKNNSQSNSQLSSLMLQPDRFSFSHSLLGDLNNNIASVLISLTDKFELLKSIVCS